MAAVETRLSVLDTATLRELAGGTGVAERVAALARELGAYALDPGETGLAPERHQLIVADGPVDGPIVLAAHYPEVPPEPR